MGKRKTVAKTTKIKQESKNNGFPAGFAVGLRDCFFWKTTIDRDGEKVYYSENIKEVTGYSGGEVSHFPGHGAAILFEDDIHRVKRVMSEFAADTSSNFITLTYRIVKKNKRIAWIKESISVERDENGIVKAYNGFVSDVSDIKNEELRQVKTLEGLQSLNASKDKFISVLSHDLRAPFTSILGFSEILMNEPNLSHKEQLEYLSYINDSSQNQLQLINYLLDWSRLQTGRIKIEPQRLHAQSLVFNCVSSLTGNAIRKNIDIKVTVEDNIYVQADERLLSQVITNLISNAIKFSPEGKSIEVFADVFNINFVEFVVRDEGKGISEDNKAKIFKFEKMFSTEGTKGEKGTGLGLSLVKEIVEKHNGEVWFYSEKEKGSEFHFTIPRSKDSILLIDNNAADMARLDEVINKKFSRFEIICAQNGYEAIEKFFDKLPSLVITVYDMPLMNGVQFINMIRLEDKNQKIPVVAVIPDGDKNIKKEFQNIGVNIILKKPVDMDLLADKLGGLLQNM